MRTGRMQCCGGRVTFFAAIIVMAAAFGWEVSPARAQPSPCGPTPPCENWLEVGSDWAPVGETVEIPVAITQAGTPWRGYRANIEYDSSVINFVSADVGWCQDFFGPCVVDVNMGSGLRETRLHNYRTSGTSSATGVMALVQYSCVGGGSTTLRLVPPPNGSTTYGADLGPIPTGLTGGYIYCEAPPPTWTPTPTPTATPTVTPTATATPTPTQCPDADGDTCGDCDEQSAGLDPLVWYDFYDVPAPARPDMAPNGMRNQVVDFADVLAVAFYVFADDDEPPNPNAVDYDSIKGSCDYDGDTTPDEEGKCYDRAPGIEPSPPWDAGPPNGIIDIGDLLAVLAQALELDCSYP